MSTLEQIKARAAKATPGPWHIDSDEQTIRAIDPVNGDIMFDRSMVCRRDWFEEEQSTAEFIAHAPDDIARLVAALEAVEAWCSDQCVVNDDGAWVDADDILTAIRTALEGTPK